MKSLERQLEEEKKANQAIVDLLDEALQKVGYSENVINGLTISGKIDFLVRAAQQHRAMDGDRRCPACNSLLEETSVYCDNCGTDTPRR